MGSLAKAIEAADRSRSPATGRPIVWRDMLTSRFRDGRIAEEWVGSDLAERLLHAREGERVRGRAP